jgi:homoserine dehydrogenase
MQPVNIGIIGLGNVGEGTLTILTESAANIEAKLGFPLRITAVCSRGIAKKKLPPELSSIFKTADWREVVNRPDVDVVVELIGGTGAAREIIDAAIANGKSVVTANKELMAMAGGDLWDRATKARVNLAMEASVAGGIPIHAVLREGISGDRINTLYGILNGTCNFILTEIETRGASFDDVLATMFWPKLNVQVTLRPILLLMSTVSMLDRSSPF